MYTAWPLAGYALASPQVGAGVDVIPFATHPREYRYVACSSRLCVFPHHHSQVPLHPSYNTDTKKRHRVRQDPQGGLFPLVLMYSRPGDLCLDLFGGSGAFAAA